jgi:hypothetical protein
VWQIPDAANTVVCAPDDECAVHTQTSSKPFLDSGR